MGSKQMKAPGRSRVGRRGALASTIVALVLFTALLLVPASAQADSFPLLRQFCPSGQGAGQCSLPSGIAVDQASGHFYVTNSDNKRVDEFTAWGEFVKTWGWGVVASGPGDKPRNEREQVTVDATGGTFELRYGFNVATTGPIAFDAAPEEVQSALEALSIFDPGDVTVGGPAGGPWTIDFAGNYADTDFVGGGNGTLFSSELEALSKDEEETSTFGLTGGAATVTVSTLRQGANFEVCVPADGDVCQAGQEGVSAGQFRAPQGVAVDASGDVYVIDRQNHRVQKFDSKGDFLLMFGSGVERGPLHPSDICTAQHIAEGDGCGAGSKGSGDGQFGWLTEGPVYSYGSWIAVSPGSPETVYVGDVNRIQKFDAAGSFIGEITGPALAEQTVQSLAVDLSGDLYVALAGKENVLRLSPIGALVDTLELPRPRAIAIGAGGKVYVFEIGSAESSAEVIQFDSAGSKILSFGKNEFEQSIGLATSSACGIKGSDIFVANWTQFTSFVRAYGPPPDPDICPPPSIPPSIEAQFATSADSGGATVKARINPHFWPDTRYYVQYGTGKCSEGGCDQEQPASPGSLLTKEVFDAERATADVFIGGLLPNTNYHYRFVAASGGGGPTFGGERTLHTLSASEPSVDSCPNEAFRTGASAKLPDCRAYELVSPLDKNNGDVAIGADSFAQVAPDGQRMTFTSLRSFAEPEGAPLFNQYLAIRQKGTGWMTRAIAPPRSTVSLYPLGAQDSNYYKAFSSDLCSGWVLQDTDRAVTPEAPAGVPNLYRRNNCGDGSYELITSTPPPPFDKVSLETLYFPEIQGFSADGSHSVFRANASLAVAGGGPRAPFVCSVKTEAETVSYQWLSDGVPITAATSSTYTATAADQGKSIQCQVTAADAGVGASLLTSEASVAAPTSPPGPPDPGIRTPSHSTRSQLPGTPTIAGTPKVGETLSCTPGNWLGSPTFSYQWYRDAVAIGGATVSNYVLTAADKGTTVQCRAIGTNAGGTAVTDSKGMLIEASPPLASAEPTISGTAALGEALTCNPGTWSGGPAFSYQWLR